MHPIHVLWGTPRSTSTAFEWMMRMRGDMACFHEPYGEAWYQGDDARWPRLREDSPRQPGLTFESVTAQMLKASEKRPVFSKDFPQYTTHLWTEGFLGLFKHSFLVRHPSKVLVSCARNWEKFYPEEIGFDVLHTLFDSIAQRDGTPPPVIDSDDLLRDPHRMVQLWCEAIDIPFVPEALSWKPGARSEVSWYDKGSWHDTLRNSDGLKPQAVKSYDITTTPDWVQEMYEVFLPHYEHLHAHRLRLPEAVDA